MNQHTILSENSEHHWPYLNTEGKILLDLGCGRHDTHDIYQSSAVYLGEKGATKIIAIDASPSEIDYFNSNNINPEKYTFFGRYIDSPESIKELIETYNPSVIKCDIEGHETNFYPLTKEDMKNVVELGLEYHSLDILEKITNKIQEWGFTIHTEAKFGFVSAPHMGVLFCSKNS
jgi:hypothetical protein